MGPVRPMPGAISIGCVVQCNLSGGTRSSADLADSGMPIGLAAPLRME